MSKLQLATYLEAGFIDDTVQISDERFMPKILTNNQLRKTRVLDNLIYELEHCDEFFFSVAFVTESGVHSLLDTLDSLCKKHIHGKILASQYQNFTEPRALRRLLQFPNIELKMITNDYNFHAKGYLFHLNESIEQEENYRMIVGSSNLTASALTVNREWNVELSSLKNGALIKQMQTELERAWDDAVSVTEQWLNEYEQIYRQARSQRIATHNKIVKLNKVNPNKMQEEALVNIARLRDEGKDKALLISATGTGKTFLSAFDVAKVAPKRCLFMVHRRNIAQKSLESFQRVLSEKIKMGIYSGSTKETDADYLFATIQTLAKDENLHSFAPDDFDYIIVDEVHHAGAESYQKILHYFKPKFLLGMTATPERSDGYDIFKDFNYNIAYEIRLEKALSENMLVPFHYHGVSEIEVDGQLLDEMSDFNKLTCDERIKNIIHYADFYGCDQGRIKGLVFCSRLDEAQSLCVKFNERGKRAAVISGNTSEEQRRILLERLEIDDSTDTNALDYLFSVDVLNEGIDIPSVNQIILLRPTESAIVFVQQLGRGLRKAKNKRFLEVIDFIGNYTTNFLLPIALYGDRSYNKEHIKRVMHNNYMPGASTVHFDDVVKERIFKAINTGNFSAARDLKTSYELIKFKLGRDPYMMDFIELGDRDPYLFLQMKINIKDNLSGKFKNSYAKSFFNYRQYITGEATTMNDLQQKTLQFIGWEIANGRRLEELALLDYLLAHGEISFQAFQDYLKNKFGVISYLNTMISAIRSLNKEFLKEQDKANYGHLQIIEQDDIAIRLHKDFVCLLNNEEFTTYLQDALAYGIHTFMKDYEAEKYFYGFKLYASYTRKDACRILNWEKDESSTVYGYKIKYDTCPNWEKDESSTVYGNKIKYNTCPIFVTYNKSEDISESTKYEDYFVSPNKMHWMTKSNRRYDSSDAKGIRDDKTIKLLFVKKSDAEGSEFYFMGILKHLESFETTKLDDAGAAKPIVEVNYEIKPTVDYRIYEYFV